MILLTNRIFYASRLECAEKTWRVNGKTFRPNTHGLAMNTWGDNWPRAREMTVRCYGYGNVGKLKKLGLSLTVTVFSSWLAIFVQRNQAQNSWLKNESISGASDGAGETSSGSSLVYSLPPWTNPRRYQSWQVIMEVDCLKRHNGVNEAAWEPYPQSANLHSRNKQACLAFHRLPFYSAADLRT